jgi:hypothetical protein
MLTLKEIFNVRSILIIHSVWCLVFGFLALALPHSVYLSFPYNHFAHEFIRLYGCLTLGIGWLTWSARVFRDGRLMKIVSETFAITYILHFVVLVRAQYSTNEHSLLHWTLSFVFLLIGSLYLYIRLSSSLKEYDLPGSFSD